MSKMKVYTTKKERGHPSQNFQNCIHAYLRSTSVRPRVHITNEGSLGAVLPSGNLSVKQCRAGMRPMAVQLLLLGGGRANMSVVRKRVDSNRDIRNITVGGGFLPSPTEIRVCLSLKRYMYLKKTGMCDLVWCTGKLVDTEETLGQVASHRADGASGAFGV